VCFIVFKHEFAREKKYTRRSIFAYREEAFGLGSPSCDTKTKERQCGRFIDKALFVDERMTSSMTAPVAMSIPKIYSNYGEHTLIPVTVKMIHSAVSTCNSTCKRFVLGDGCLLHMVKLVGAVRGRYGNTKNITIGVEEGIRLVGVIVWH
jgi:hypothetical protein